VNEAMQRMLPAVILTLALHSALLSWQIQGPQRETPKPLSRKITVNLTRLPPPPPPMKKIIQEVKAVPEIVPTEHQLLRPLAPKPKPMKKIVQKVRTLPRISQVQHQSIRPVRLKPGKKISTAPTPLPQLTRVTQQPLKPLVVPAPRPREIAQPKQALPVIESHPISQQVSHQQPVVRRPVTYSRPYQQPSRRSTESVRRPSVTGQVVSSSSVRRAAQPVQPVQPTQPAHSDVVREAAPLYKTNPPPEYPRMARRRGLEGVVTIEAKIDPHGTVAELRIFAGSGHALLDKAALKAVRNWRFSPGTVGGRAQAMWVKVPVRFELH